MAAAGFKTPITISENIFMPSHATDISSTFRQSGTYHQNIGRSPSLDKVLDFVDNRLALSVIEMSSYSTKVVEEASKETQSVLLISSLDVCIGIALYSPSLGVVRGFHHSEIDYRVLEKELLKFPEKLRSELILISAGQVSFDIVEAQTLAEQPNFDLAKTKAALSMEFTRERAEQIFDTMGIPKANLILRDYHNYQDYGKLSGMSLLVVPEKKAVLVFGEPRKEQGFDEDRLLETIKLPV